MRIKPSPFEIPEENPFQNDKLNRTQAVEAISQILVNTGEPLVISVNSPWGTGKTKFLRLLDGRLRNMGVITLFVNAWENDFSDNALVSLVTELDSRLHGIKKVPKSDAMFRKLKKAAVAVIKIGIPFAVRIATSGAVNLPSSIEGNLGDFFQKLAEEQIKTYEKAKSDIRDFKTRLRELSATLTENQQSLTPIVLLIDELDRCRPNYALEMLEAAKHIFDVPGFTFVLAIDKHQISESIKAIYGSGMNVEEYLRRFFDLQYELSNPDKEEYCKSLFQRFDFESYFDERKEASPAFKTDQQEFITTGLFLFDLFGFSLRAIEQCFSQLSLILRTTKANAALYPMFVMYLLVIKSIDNPLYERIVNKGATIQEVLDIVRKHPNYPRKSAHRFNIDYLEALVALALMDELKAESEYKGILQSSQNADERTHAEKILKIMQHIELTFGPGDVLGYLKKKVEYTDPFIH